MHVSERRACAALGQHRSTQRKVPRGRNDEERFNERSRSDILEMTLIKQFSLELLRAINDWQQGGNARKKHYRGQTLKRVCATLDDRFRRCGLVVFRKVSLKKSPLWQLLAKGSLGETISAWTASTDVAKTFKDGVPEPGWQGVILQYHPEPGSVIVNLSTLYACPAFKEATQRQRANIASFDLGMGKFKGSQAEVVIERRAVSPENIHALGGYSSEPQHLGRVIFGRDVTNDEVTWMRRVLQKHGQDFGPWWIQDQAKDRVLRRIQEQMEHFAQLK